MQNSEGMEIEVKYLIWEDGIEYTTNEFLKIFPSINNLKSEILLKGIQIHQGYLTIDEGLEIAKEICQNVDFEPHKIRLRDKNGIFYLGIKSKGKISRKELEPKITKKIFDKYWPKTIGKRVHKLRLEKKYNNKIIEFDLYNDERDLIIAEIELNSEEEISSLIPIGKEISSKSKYKNSNLAK